MLRVSDIYNKAVFVRREDRSAKEPKQKKRHNRSAKTKSEFEKIGKIHMTVFAPDGSHVVGFMIKRPDIAGMIKREDRFLGFDSFTFNNKNVYATQGEDSFDNVAKSRLGIEWDHCVMWTGMDAKTTDGFELGYVNDAEFDKDSGEVSKFYVGDGGISQQLVGSVEIPSSMLRGYAKGYMLVDPNARKLCLNGGFAARAGEATAKAKIGTTATGKKIGSKASHAVNEGSFEFGKILGKTKRAYKEAANDSSPQRPVTAALNVSVEPTSRPAPLEGEVKKGPGHPVTYVPATQAKSTAVKSQTKKAPVKKQNVKKGRSTQDVAHAFGRQLGKLNSAFDDFGKEYKKARH
jgi:uncharacterized protein YrrD